MVVLGLSNAEYQEQNPCERSIQIRLNFNNSSTAAHLAANK
ncbi:unnamed protein product [Acidithrix sp. C25]|nr:unnamed protein product [Acidithrix sp. C25]